MKKIELISYSDFGKLRLRDFLPPIAHCDRCFECALGYSGCDEAVGVYFAWPQDRPNELGEITLEIGEEAKHYCDPKVVQRILDAIKLPLRPKMSVSEILELLGEPVYSRDWPTGCSSFDFNCYGERGAKYDLCCWAHPTDGFCGIQIVRDDLRERPEAMER